VTEAPGGGAEFRVVLPAESAVDAAITPVQLEIEAALLESAPIVDITAGD
jgi:hypothetical protein